MRQAATIVKSRIGSQSLRCLYCCQASSPVSKFHRTDTAKQAMRRIRSLLFLLIGSLGIQATLAEDRLGLQVISDGIVTRAQRPEESYPDSDFRFNGQAAV